MSMSDTFVQTNDRRQKAYAKKEMMEMIQNSDFASKGSGV